MGGGDWLINKRDALRLALSLGATITYDSGEAVVKYPGHPTLRIGVGSHNNSGVHPRVRAWLRRVQRTQK